MVHGRRGRRVVLSVSFSVFVSQVCGARVFFTQWVLVPRMLESRLCWSAICFALLLLYEGGIPDISVDCIVVREYI